MLPLAVAATALLLVAVCALTIDEPVARLALQAPSWLRAVAQRFSDIGLSGYMLVSSALVAAAGFMMARGKHFSPLRLLGERALFVFAAVALSGIAVQLIKHVVGRARPKGIATLDAFHFDVFSIKASLASFPSGHSTSIFTLAVALGLLAPRLRLPLFGLAVLVGLARIVLAAHFASDVVGGAALGILSALGVAGAFADRSIAFVRRSGAVRLKGEGTVWRGLYGRGRIA